MIIAPVSLVNIKKVIKGKDLRRCKDFAEKTTPRCLSLYKKRGACSEQKIYQDILLGKAAEIAAYLILKDYDPSISKPDYSVAETQSFKHDPDLQSNKWNYHIKSTTFLSNPSWLFSKYDPMFREESKKDIALLFTNEWSVSSDEVISTLKFIVKLKHHKPDGVPISPIQAKRKKAFYADDLIKILGV